MGVFLQAVIIKGRGVMPTKKYLRMLAEDGAFGLVPQDCVLRARPGGTAVLCNDGCSGYEDLAKALSEQTGGPVLLSYLYDEDFWGYFLYDGGKERDRFSPVPDYFGDVNKAEEARCAGNAAALSQCFGVPEERLSGYLCRWPEEGLEGTAYPGDQFGYGPWQMADFAAALGFPLPLPNERTQATAAEAPSHLAPPEPAIQVPDARPMAETAPKAHEPEPAPAASYHFQVNLGGMLDVLSNHLYKSPDVFLRELLQNGVDAITLRQKEKPGWNGGCIHISLEPGRRMVFRDNGAGLSEEGIHRFLAVIGQSSKTELVKGKIPEDYIGRFGIGLLSCFMVSDSIVVHTKPAAGGPAHVWTGLPDGTYTLEPLEECRVGTAVILTAKPGAEHYFLPEKVEELVRYYGLALPAPVYLNGNPERLNSIPANFAGISRSQLLSFGEWLFEEEFLEAIPIQTPHLSGVAYVLSYRTDSSVKTGHRIYLKQMLLTERGDTLLPPWAFFLRCFLNTRSLRPTASREDFYEDDELEQARVEFAGAVRKYLAELSQDDPDRLGCIVRTHAQAIKSMAVWDEDLFRLFIDYLVFETSEGNMTGAALKKAGEGAWVSSVPKFKQLKPIFLSQGKLLICTGYTNDEELISQLAHTFSLPLSPLQEDSMNLVLEEPALEESQRAFALLRAADLALEEFDCKAEARRFLPCELPALYSMSDEVQFLRQVQSARENSTGVFSDALTSLLEGVEERPLATLYLNLNSPLIRRLTGLADGALLESMTRVLYVQALLAGGHPLRGGELKLLNRELLNLIDHASRDGLR